MRIVFSSSWYLNEFIGKATLYWSLFSLWYSSNVNRFLEKWINLRLSEIRFKVLFDTTESLQCMIFEKTSHYNWWKMVLKFLNAVWKNNFMRCETNNAIPINLIYNSFWYKIKHTIPQKYTQVTDMIKINKLARYCQTIQWFNVP